MEVSSGFGEWAAGTVDPPSGPSSPQRRQLAVALLPAMVIHVLLLSLALGGQGFGLPGFSLPWSERRIELADLQVMLLPERPPAEAVVPEEPALPLTQALPTAAPDVQAVTSLPPAGTVLEQAVEAVPMPVIEPDVPQVEPTVEPPMTVAALPDKPLPMPRMEPVPLPVRPAASSASSASSPEPAAVPALPTPPPAPALPPPPSPRPFLFPSCRPCSQRHPPLWTWRRWFGNRPSNSPGSRPRSRPA